MKYAINFLKNYISNILFLFFIAAFSFFTYQNKSDLNNLFEFNLFNLSLLVVFYALSYLAKAKMNQHLYSTKDISMYINSPGGIVTSGLAIYDTMEYIRPGVSTVCMGQAASMGSLLLMAGAAGKRYGILNKPKEDEEPQAEACYIDPDTGQKSCE